MWLGKAKRVKFGALEQTKQRKFWNVSIKIYEGHLKPLLIQMADILY